MNVPTKSDREDFALYCRQCTRNQLINIHEQELAAHRRVYADIAKQELLRRDHDRDH